MNKIVAEHLDTMGNVHQKSVAQMITASKDVKDAFISSNSKSRQERYLRAVIEQLIHRFLKKRVRGKYLESDGFEFSDEFDLSISWNMKKIIDDSEDFMEYFEYYWNHGYNQKQDFHVGVLDIEDTVDVMTDLLESNPRLVPEIIIPYENMRSIMPKKFPNSRNAWLKLVKAVYTRSRTRGFVDPTTVQRITKRLVNHYVFKLL